MTEALKQCVKAMEKEGLPDLAVRTFCLHLERLLAGETGKLRRENIDRVDEIPDAETFGQYRKTGQNAMGKVAIIKLNGGLGTSMGLAQAKSLLPVRDGLSFLDLIARQVIALRMSSGSDVPLVFMNSFRTSEDTNKVLAQYHNLAVDGMPLGFLQNKVPKISAASFHPARLPEDRELEWCPPGHGDIYTAFETSGVFDRFSERGIEYVFMSNADNLGAVFDAEILGFMVKNNIDFLIEAADRTDADRKGGHLCRLKNGRLALRESAQCPVDEEQEFQDVEVFRYFNTNNVWVHLPSLRQLLAENQGILPLSTIVNHKTLDPRNSKSTKVIQLETAMGSALSLFPKAAAVRVSRQRFSPVKTTNDLLGVRSDAYELSEDFRVRLHQTRTTPPTIMLDPRYYKKINDFDLRFPDGSPSLRACSSLTIDGDVVFSRNVSIVGKVSISTTGGQAHIEENVTVDGDLVLDGT